MREERRMEPRRLSDLSGITLRIAPAMIQCFDIKLKYVLYMYSDTKILIRRNLAPIGFDRERNESYSYKGNIMGSSIMHKGRVEKS